MQLKTLKVYIKTHLKIGLFNFLNFLQGYLYFLIKSFMAAFIYVLITKA